MMFNFHLCLTVLLLTMFGSVFCVRSLERLRDNIYRAKLTGASPLLADHLLGDVAEYCESKQKSKESADAKLTAEKLSKGGINSRNAIMSAEKEMSEIGPFLGFNGS
ncbi:uncharacterized protein LOC141857836 [Brevipalpus obovatus]|uniref:uncharacterized protein LOC141857836 n=1 Tax=Brevipalpus obovatus TaxID=246614 RepID=UPI003D9DD6EC